METSIPLDFLGGLQRTHTCGELRATDEGAHVVLMGWVHRRRDHGGVIFADLRDRDGITQVLFHEDVDPAVHGAPKNCAQSTWLPSKEKYRPGGQPPLIRISPRDISK